MKVLAFAQQRNGALTPEAREALAFAVRLAGQTGGEAGAILAGNDLEQAAKEAIAYGAGKVIMAESPLLADYQVELYGHVIGSAFRRMNADVLVIPFDRIGKEQVGRLAARLSAAAVTEVVDFEVKDGRPRWLRPIYGGKATGEYVSDRSKTVIGLRPKTQSVPSPDAARTGEIVQAEFSVSEQMAVTKLVEEIASGLEGMRLEDARIIVSGGRGVGGADGFALLQELADVLGAAVGASRAACDAGWVPPSRQIGQTGAVVAPDLYIAVGISGASQHLAGIMGAKTVVAINTDPDAPIFKRANFGVVADYRTVIPALTAELKKRAL